MGKEAKAVLVDEGYRGRSTIGNTMVLRVHQKSIKDYQDGKSVKDSVEGLLLSP
jgi:hypothetical protein